MHYTLYIALIGTPVVLMVYGITLFNRLSRKRNQIENAISSLDALFIQRADLLPNLIASVKQYMVFERETLEKITVLRHPAATQAGNPYLKPEEGSSILRQIMIQVENYPELKAGSQFAKLQYSFQECEEQIAAGRRFLSASITDYNTSTALFPLNIAAKLFGFKPHQWQYASEVQRQSVNVQDLFQKS
jgi:LemA protein